MSTPCPLRSISPVFSMTSAISLLLGELLTVSKLPIFTPYGNPPGLVISICPGDCLIIISPPICRLLWMQAFNTASLIVSSLKEGMSIMPGKFIMCNSGLLAGWLTYSQICFIPKNSGSRNSFLAEYLISPGLFLYSTMTFCWGKYRAMYSLFPISIRAAYVTPSGVTSFKSDNNWADGISPAARFLLFSRISFIISAMASPSKSSIVNPEQMRAEKSGSCSCNMEKYSASSISRKLSPTRIKGTPSNLKAFPKGRLGIFKTRTLKSSRPDSSYSSSACTRMRSLS